MTCKRAAFWTVVVAMTLTSSLVQAADPYEVTVERGVKAKMRDGVILRADIYRPKADGQFPVLLQRTPYDKRGGVEFGYKAAVHGFVVIVQDVRGRYTSDGEFYTFKHESDDGFDTVEWAAALPYSNGKVGMWGGSYVGATQMLAAIAHPPHHDGLDDAVGLDRLRELLESGLVDVPAGLEFIRREAVDIRLDSGGRPWRRQIRNQRAEAFTECGTFFHGDHVERNAREDRQERLGFARIVR